MLVRTFYFYFPHGWRLLYQTVMRICRQRSAHDFLYQNALRRRGSENTLPATSDRRGFFTCRPSGLQVPYVIVFFSSFATSYTRAEAPSTIWLPFLQLTQSMQASATDGSSSPCRPCSPSVFGTTIRRHMMYDPAVTEPSAASGTKHVHTARRKNFDRSVMDLRRG